MSEPSEQSPTPHQESAEDLDLLTGHGGFNHHDDEDHEEHIDEKWLVSYSDMMTLLFGLFVMLYSLAMEHKGSIDGELKKIHQTEAPRSVPAENARQDLVNDLAEARLMRRELDALKRAADENEELKQEITALKELAQLLENERDRLESRIPSSESVDRIDKLNAEIHTRDSEIATLRQELMDLERENTATKTELAVAQSHLDEQRVALESGEFLLIVMTWATEQHDLDMKIKDPKGNSFDFKTRAKDTVPGEFIVDSRSGPGIEAFQANSPLQGDYEIKVDFIFDALHANGAPQSFIDRVSGKTWTITP